MILLFSLTIPPAFAGAESEVSKTDQERKVSLPPEYGEVIYRCNEGSPNQLYIIGMSHRDALTRANGSKTVRAQAEAYKIGEWLVENQGLELFLPEGFFKNPAKKGLAIQAAHLKSAPPELDMKSLEEKLAADPHINAEILLKNNYCLNIQQVEDPHLYNEVGKGLSNLVSCRDDAQYLLLKSELDYLQGRRTAFMLQRIPEIIEDEFQQGNIQSRKGLFTIGLYHIGEIIKFVNEGKITVYCPLFASGKNTDYCAPLNLSKENFGVTVILPRTLADDPKILKATRLDEIVRSSRNSSPALPSAH